MEALPFKKIQGDGRTYSFDDIIRANCDSADNLRRMLMFLYICYNDSIYSGDIVKIIKLFLCSQNIIFDNTGPAPLTVANARVNLGMNCTSEINYLEMVSESFLLHIQKHWDIYEPKVGETVNMVIARHGLDNDHRVPVSGLVVYNNFYLNMSMEMRQYKLLMILLPMRINLMDYKF